MAKLKLYLDGCSFVWGANLDPQYNLNTLFGYDFEVTNLSRGGKSNLAIAMDYHKHAQDHNVVVIGWTFATRFYLKYDTVNLDFFPTRARDLHPIPGIQTDINLLEDAYFEFHKHFYRLYSEPFISEFSDMLVDQAQLIARDRQQTPVFFTWEHRNTKSPVYNPFIPDHMRLPCNHLNKQGTEYLHTVLRQKIDEQ